MPLARFAQRSPLHDVRGTLTDRDLRALARSGWTADDVREVQALARDRAGEVLRGVLAGDFPDTRPATVLAWLTAGREPLLDALADPLLHRRQVMGMQCWSRTFGALGPLAHAAGLALPEAVHLLAAGDLTRESLLERAAGRSPRAVNASWSDALR